MKLQEKELEKPIRAWIGMDWADEKHDVSLYEVGSEKEEAFVIRQTPEALQEWLGQLRSRYEGGYVGLLSIKLCLMSNSSSGLLKARLKHSIELRKSRGDGACNGSPSAIFQR